MNTKTLLNLLSIVGTVQLSSWNIVMEIVDCIKRGRVKIVNSCWAEHGIFTHTCLTPSPNLSDIETWSTFERTCVDIRFRMKNEQLCCSVSIYEGDNFNGRRMELRFQAELVFPSSFIKKFEEEVNYAFKMWLEKEWENHLLLKKELWIKELRNKIISK